MNPTTKHALTAKSLAAYGVVVRARKMPCDSLLGRIYREREKQSLTAFPLSRVRSLASSPQTKERPGLSRRLALRSFVFLFFWVGLVTPCLCVCVGQAPRSNLLKCGKIQLDLLLQSVSGFCFFKVCFVEVCCRLTSVWW